MKIRYIRDPCCISAAFIIAWTAAAGGADDFMTITPVHEVRPYQDVRFKDLRGIDFSGKGELPATFWFNQKTVWPDSNAMPRAAASLLADMKNPGLGVRKLHAQGITGKGVKVAIIDQPLWQDHPEFTGKIVAYHDVGCESETSMHGPAVASLLVGSECGTAPEARLYYVAAPSWTGDSAFYAKSLDWLVEQNAKMPAGDKIRVVSVSAAPSGKGSPFKKNQQSWDVAVIRAGQAGILVLDCSEEYGFIGPCYYDAKAPEDVTRCKPGFPSMPGRLSAGGRLLVPCSPRSTAEEYIKGEYSYQYCGQGGLSWSIPYCAGVLALGWQVSPELTPIQIRELLFSSAHKVSEGALIIDPAEFIRLVKAKGETR